MKKLIILFITFAFIFSFAAMASGMGSNGGMKPHNPNPHNKHFMPGKYTAQYPDGSHPFVAYLDVGDNGKIESLTFDLLSECSDPEVASGVTPPPETIFPTTVQLLKENYGLLAAGEYVTGVPPAGEWYEQADALADAIVKNQGWNNKKWELYYKDKECAPDGTPDFVDVLLFDDSEGGAGRDGMPDAVSGCTIHVEEFVVVWNMVVSEAQRCNGGNAGKALDPDGNPYDEVAEACGGPPPSWPPCPWVTPTEEP